MYWSGSLYPCGLSESNREGGGMISVVDRFVWDNFRDYFSEDFDSPAWDAIGPDARGAMVARRIALPNGKYGWAPLEKKEFLAEVERREKLTPAGNVISTEVVLSPPKTFSIAALCGAQINSELLAIDDRAGRLAGGIIRRDVSEG